MNSLKKKQAMRESLVDTSLALAINFPLNMVLLYIANRTFLPKLTEEASQIFWTSVFLTVVFTSVAIVRKYFMRQWFDKRNQKELQIKA